MSIALDTVSIQNTRITYAEHLPKVSKPGEVIFADLSASIHGLSNDSLLKVNREPIVMEAQTSVMDAGLLTVRATFPMHDTDRHRVEGALGSMAMNELNPVMEPLGFISITSGDIDSMKFDMELTSESATGYVLFSYSGLSVELLERDNIAESGNKKLVSLLTNMFKIKSNNNSKPPREGTISFDRDSQKSIFNYWWKSLLSGLEKSIGL